MKTQIQVGLTFALLVVSVALWVISALPRQTPQPSAASRSTSNAVITQQIGFTNFGTHLFSISNRTWIQLESAAIVNVTDSEWELLTNAFPKHVRTNNINIFK